MGSPIGNPGTAADRAERDEQLIEALAAMIAGAAVREMRQRCLASDPRAKEDAGSPFPITSNKL